MEAAMYGRKMGKDRIPTWEHCHVDKVQKEVAEVLTRCQTAGSGC